MIAGQHATAFAYGKTGILLGGSGAFSPIQQGKPRAPTVECIPVPQNGFTAPRHATNERGAELTLQSKGHTVRPTGNLVSSPMARSVSTCSGSPTVSCAITQQRQAMEELAQPRTRRLPAGQTAARAIATKVSAHRAAWQLGVCKCYHRCFLLSGRRPQEQRQGRQQYRKRQWGANGSGKPKGTVLAIVRATIPAGTTDYASIIAVPRDGLFAL